MALIGAGNRGCVYSDYSLDRPQELIVVAVVESNPERLAAAGKRYGVDKSMLFTDLEEFLKKKVVCDFVVNATMDQQHYETAKKLITHKCDMLLEKPIVPDRDQLIDLQNAALENDVKVVVCHVLRYAPFFKRIKQIIHDGVIGEIMTMEMNEHVWIAHFLDSFIRGKWNSEAKCGSSFLLAKSCHDMDLICWLNNSTTPKKVVSLGSRAQFILQKAPEGATEFCYSCPHNSTCYYSAQKVHLEFDSLPFQTWEGMGKPIDEITKEEKAEYLTYSDYGRCAYNSGGDINDRQEVAIEFEDGSVASFTMVGGTCKAGRYMHICGTRGEIEGMRLPYALLIVAKGNSNVWKPSSTLKKKSFLILLTADMVAATLRLCTNSSDICKATKVHCPSPNSTTRFTAISWYSQPNKAASKKFL